MGSEMCIRDSHKSQLRHSMQGWMAEFDGAMGRLATGRLDPRFSGGLLQLPSGKGVTLAEHRELLGGLVRRHLPLRLSGLPCFYPFGGADLLTATALVPDAPHYIIVSKLPLGDPECFLNAKCRSAALMPLFYYFRAWADHFFAWTETSYMHK